MSILDSAELIIEREDDPDKRAAMRGVLRELEKKLETIAKQERNKEGAA